MQQLYLTGAEARRTATRLLTAMSLRPVGYRLLPLVIGGLERGSLMHLLTPGCSALQNDLPCVLRLSEGRQVTIHEVYSEIAAPYLRRSPTMHAPILLDDLSFDALTDAAFLEAVNSCLCSDAVVIAIVRPDAEAFLRSLTDPVNQLWINCTAETLPQECVRLQEELSMRL